MKPYVLSVLPEEDVKLFKEIQKIIERFPDIDLGKDEAGEEVVLSCHILARAVGKVFSLRYVDGLFYPNYQHTWLLTANGNILDVYPVGMLGGPIILVDADPYGYSPARWLYKKKRVLRGRAQKPSFKRAVRKVEAVVSELKADI